MSRVPVAALLLFASVTVFGAAGDRNAPVWFLRVQSAPGDVRSHKSGGARLGNAAEGSGGGYTKTTSTTLRWTAEVRLRGKASPKAVEVRAFYVGRSGGAGAPRILRQEALPVTLDAQGKGAVTLVAPTVTETRTRQQSSSGARYGGSGFVHSSTSVQGERMEGCVVQLVVDGRVTKAWASVSAWAKVAWDDPFTQASLVRRPKNALR